MPHSTFHIRAELLRQLTSQKYNVVLVPSVTIQVVFSLFFDFVSNPNLCISLVTVVILIRYINLHVFKVLALLVSIQVHRGD